MNLTVLYHFSIHQVVAVEEVTDDDVEIMTKYEFQKMERKLESEAKGDSSTK